MLEREPEPPVVRVVVGRDAEQRGHDPPDRAGRALHVAAQLLPAGDPHRRAVDAHRAHVDLQLVQRQRVAAGGVDERAHHRVRRAAVAHPALQLAPPRRPAPRGAPPASARGAGRRRAGRRCGRSRRARAWRAARSGGQPARRPVVRRVVAPVHPAAGVVGVGERRIHGGHHACTRWKHSCADRRLLYVTGKGGVGKTTVAAALGLAAAEAGRRTIVCEVAEQDRVSRAFRREGVTAETEVQLAENLWAITIDPTEALREWLAKQLGGGAPLRLMTRSHAFQYFVAAAPGAKELITIAKVWELAQLSRWDDAQPHLRPRGRRRAGLRARAGDAHHAAHVRRDRPRRADPPPGEQDPGTCSATPSAPATSRSRCRRRCRSSRRSSSAGKLPGGRRPRARGDHRQRRLAGALQRRGRRSGCAPPRATATTPRRGRRAQPRSPSTSGRVMQRGHLERLTKRERPKRRDPPLPVRVRARAAGVPDARRTSSPRVLEGRRTGLGGEAGVRPRGRPRARRERGVDRSR